MAQGKSRNPRKERRWRRWLELWQRSGLTVRAFCECHYLAQPSFYAWRRALRQRDAAAVPFVPVRIVPDDRPVPVAHLEVLVASGRWVRVAPGFDPATLRRLLAVLEEVPSC